MPFEARYGFPCPGYGARFVALHRASSQIYQYEIDNEGLVLPRCTVHVKEWLCQTEGVRDERFESDSIQFQGCSHDGERVLISHPTLVMLATAQLEDVNVHLLEAPPARDAIEMSVDQMVGAPTKTTFEYFVGGLCAGNDVYGRDKYISMTLREAATYAQATEDALG